MGLEGFTRTSPLGWTKKHRLVTFGLLWESKPKPYKLEKKEDRPLAETKEAPTAEKAIFPETAPNSSTFFHFLILTSTIPEEVQKGALTSPVPYLGSKAS